MLLGATGVKAAHRMLMKLTPGRHQVVAVVVVVVVAFRFFF